MTREFADKLMSELLACPEQAYTSGIPKYTGQGYGFGDEYSFPTNYLSGPYVKFIGAASRNAIKWANYGLGKWRAWRSGSGKVDYGRPAGCLVYNDKGKREVATEPVWYDGAWTNFIPATATPGFSPWKTAALDMPTPITISPTTSRTLLTELIGDGSIFRFPSLKKEVLQMHKERIQMYTSFGNFNGIYGDTDESIYAYREESDLFILMSNFYPNYLRLTEWAASPSHIMLRIIISENPNYSGGEDYTVCWQGGLTDYGVVLSIPDVEGEGFRYGVLYMTKEQFVEERRFLAALEEARNTEPEGAFSARYRALAAERKAWWENSNFRGRISSIPLRVPSIYSARPFHRATESFANIPLAKGKKYYLYIEQENLTKNITISTLPILQLPIGMYAPRIRLS